MQQEYLRADRPRGAIVLEVLGRVGLSVGELCNFELVGVGENHCWSEDGVNLSLQEFLHSFQFDGVPLKFRRVGQTRGYFFG